MDLEYIYKKLTWEIMTSYGKTYSLATRFYPKSVREDVAALYAFVRVADEIVDNPKYKLTNQQKIQLLTSYEKYLNDAISMRHATDPIISQVIQVIVDYTIPLNYFSSFFNSMKMDVHNNKYKTFNELRIYTYGSAEVIGLMMNSIMKGSGKKAVEGAAALGLAFQLTNFLRDVKSDYENLGRVYLPTDELENFSLSTKHINSWKTDNNWREFVNFWVNRNKNNYELANKSITYLPDYAQKSVRIASALYQDIDKYLVNNPDVIFSRRYSVPLHKKISKVIISGIRHK